MGNLAKAADATASSGTKTTEVLKTGAAAMKATSGVARGLGLFLSGNLSMGLRLVTANVRTLWLTLAANPLGALIAIISSLVTLGLPKLVGWLGKSKEAMKDTGDAARETAKKMDVLQESAKAANAELEKESQTHFETLKKDLDELHKKYDGLNKSAQEQLDFQRKMGDMDLAIELAGVDVQEQEALQKANGDAVKETKIRNHYAQKRKAAKDKNEADKAALESLVADKELFDFNAKNDELEEQVAAASTETGVQKHYKSGQKKIKELMEKTGVKSAAKKQLERLAELRAKQTSGAISSEETAALFTLQNQETGLQKEAVENVSFDQEQMQELFGAAAKIPKLQRDIADYEKYAKNRGADYANSAAGRRSGELYESWKTELAAAQDKAALFQAASENQALKPQAEKDDESQKRALEEAQKSLGEHRGKGEAIEHRVKLADKKTDEVAAVQQSSATLESRNQAEAVAKAKKDDLKKQYETELQSLTLIEETDATLRKQAALKKKIVNLDTGGGKTGAMARDVERQSIDKAAREQREQRQKKNAPSGEAAETYQRAKERESGLENTLKTGPVKLPENAQQQIADVLQSGIGAALEGRDGSAVMGQVLPMVTQAIRSINTTQAARDTLLSQMAAQMADLQRELTTLQRQTKNNPRR
jgi:hypothetical protein